MFFLLSNSEQLNQDQGMLIDSASWPGLSFGQWIRVQILAADYFITQRASALETRPSTPSLRVVGRGSGLFWLGLNISELRRKNESNPAKLPRSCSYPGLANEFFFRSGLKRFMRASPAPASPVAQWLDLVLWGTGFLSTFYDFRGFILSPSTNSRSLPSSPISALFNANHLDIIALVSWSFTFTFKFLDLYLFCFQH